MHWHAATLFKSHYIFLVDFCFLFLCSEFCWIAQWQPSNCTYPADIPSKYLLASSNNHKRTPWLDVQTTPWVAIEIFAIHYLICRSRSTTALFSGIQDIVQCDAVIWQTSASFVVGCSRATQQAAHAYLFICFCGLFIFHVPERWTFILTGTSDIRSTCSFPHPSNYIFNCLIRQYIVSNQTDWYFPLVVSIALAQEYMKCGTEV